jgi:penicillin amidase
VNNFVFADLHGNIGYRTRGQVPIRSMANAWLPVPGWNGAHEWEGMIPFEQMPVLRNPETGFVATANSKVAGLEYPHYIGLDFAPDFRTRRLVEHLRKVRGATVADMAAIHADRVSIPAREFVEILRQIPPPDAHAKAALDKLLTWDGVMDRDSVPAAIYAVFRERLFRQLMEPLLGPLTAEAFAGAPRGAVAHMARIRARLAEMIRCNDRTLLPAGDWPAAMARALSAVVAELQATLGPDVSTWHWGRIHATRPQHTLATTFPDLAPLLNPPSVPMGGDGDTVQAASFIAGAGCGVAVASAARYVFDLGDWDRSAWVVPLGSSGHPGSPHYADQATAWANVQLLPMRYEWTHIRTGAETYQVLEPA